MWNYHFNLNYILVLLSVKISFYIHIFLLTHILVRYFLCANSFFGKTAALLASTSEHSNLQKTLIRIMVVLVMLSGVLCLIVFIYLLLNVPVIEALSFTVVLMVASIPLAIEIVTTTTLALGSKELSHHGAIVARLAAIEDMAGGLSG